jgi:HK97 family phage portal protein
MIGRWFETRGEQRAVRDVSWNRWAAGNEMPQNATRVTAESAMGLLAVFGCVSLISDTISTLPVDVLQDREPVDLPEWLENPAPLDRVDFLSALLTGLLLEGNAVIAVGRDSRGRVATVDPVDPRRVRVEFVTGTNEAQFFLDSMPYPGEMLMIRGLMLPGTTRGLSPVEFARQSIGMGLGAQEQAARFYQQGAVVPGVIHAKSDLTIEQMREIRDQWLAAHGGSGKAHLPVVLTGETSWQSISMTAEQAQFLESRHFTDAQIAGQMFLIDPSMLGIGIQGTSLTYQNLEQRGVHLVRHSLLRWIVRLERGLSKLLLPGQRMKFNVNGLQRGDMNARYASYKTAADINSVLGMPLLSVQEMRDLEDLGPAVDTGLRNGQG